MCRVPLVCLILLMLVPGCAEPPRSVTLQHAATGEIVTCQEPDWATESRARQSLACVSSYVVDCRVEPQGHIDRKKKLDACVANYQRRGFIVVPPPKPAGK